MNNASVSAYNREYALLTSLLEISLKFRMSDEGGGESSGGGKVSSTIVVIITPHPSLEIVKFRQGIAEMIVRGIVLVSYNNNACVYDRIDTRLKYLYLIWL